MFYRLKNIKKTSQGRGAANHFPPFVGPRVKNPKSPNGTETNLLTKYKRGRGFSRVIQILIR